jgi:hypothetical protein
LQPFAVEVQTSGGMALRQPGLHAIAAPKHDTPNLQATSQAHASPQVISPSHAMLPAQSTLHGPVPQVTALPHDALPLHETLQRPRPHVTVLQVRPALHVIVHDVALPQLTPLLHWLAIEQPTLQIQPAGHAIAWSQAALPAEQSIVQIFWAVLHDVHCAGHAPASPAGGGVSTTPESPAITHNPSMQVRPAAQRCWPSQTKSLLRWLTEQPAASAIATAVHSASFMASLPA